MTSREGGLDWRPRPPSRSGYRHCLCSIINTEVAVKSCHWQIGFFDVRNLGQRGAGREVFFEFFHRVSFTLGYHFDAPVGHIANRAEHIMARRGAHDEEAKAHTLNTAGDQKSSGDHKE